MCTLLLVATVEFTDEEVHVEVGQIHLGDIVAAAKELLNGVQPLHLEVLAPNVLVGVAQIYASLCLAGTFLRERCW